jgi:hypothetical protein
VPRVSLSEAAARQRAGEVFTVPSASQPGRYWTQRKVAGEWTCDCRGFVYTGGCRHVTKRREEESGGSFG